MCSEQGTNRAGCVQPSPFGPKIFPNERVGRSRSGRWNTAQPGKRRRMADSDSIFVGKTYRVFNYDGQIRNAQAQPDVQALDGHLGSGT